MSMGSDVFNETENYIYVSGAEKNANNISPLLIVLKRAGCNVWYDNRAGHDTVTERIENCSYFMTYITAAYSQSEKCLDELNYAVQLGKRLLIIYGEEIELPKGIQMRLNRVQAIYRSKLPELHTFYAKILQTEAVRECGGTYMKEENREENTYIVEYDDTKTLIKNVLTIVGWVLVLSMALFTIMMLIIY